MPDQRTFHVHDGLKFTRYEPSGDVTMYVYGMIVPVPASDWISAVAEMTAHGAQVNHELFRAMHTGAVPLTIPPRRDFPTGQVNVDRVREALDHEREERK